MDCMGAMEEMDEAGREVEDAVALGMVGQAPPYALNGKGRGLPEENAPEGPVRVSTNGLSGAQSFRNRASPV